VTSEARYEHQIFGINVCDRPNYWHCASSIAGIDWNTCRIPFTAKTPHAKNNRGDSTGRERGIAFGSGVARGFADT
jgi:hypothetical protein